MGIDFNDTLVQEVTRYTWWIADEMEEVIREKEDVQDISKKVEYEESKRMSGFGGFTTNKTIKYTLDVKILNNIKEILTLRLTIGNLDKVIDKGIRASDTSMDVFDQVETEEFKADYEYWLINNDFGIDKSVMLKISTSNIKGMIGKQGVECLTGVTRVPLGKGTVALNYTLKE